jgi:hypothetical protein
MLGKLHLLLQPNSRAPSCNSQAKGSNKHKRPHLLHLLLRSCHLPCCLLFPRCHCCCHHAVNVRLACCFICCCC